MKNVGHGDVMFLKRTLGTEVRKHETVFRVQGEAALWGSEIGRGIARFGRHSEVAMLRSFSAYSEIRMKGSGN